MARQGRHTPLTAVISQIFHQDPVGSRSARIQVTSRVLIPVGSRSAGALVCSSRETRGVPARRPPRVRGGGLRVWQRIDGVSHSLPYSDLLALTSSQALVSVIVDFRGADGVVVTVGYQ